MAPARETTLLVFTLGPGREHARRRWLRRDLDWLGRAVHQRCLDEVLEAGREAGLALRVSTPSKEALAPDAELDRQAETGFGRRLLGAVRRAGEAREGPLVVVGTDTPGIDSALLGEVLERLRREPEAVVLGPATDGGFYLLAASRPLTRELEQTCWRSRRTLTTLVAALRRAGRPVRLLPARGDLDTRSDLERWAATGVWGLGATWSRLLAAVREALVRAAYAPPALVAVPATAHRPSRPGRAPPR